MRFLRVILLLSVLLTACAFLQNLSQGWVPGEEITATPGEVDPIPDCPADVSLPLFGTSPIALEDIISLIPLGNLNPPSHTFPTHHIYLSLRRSDLSDPASAPAEVDLFAPGDVWITSVVVFEHLSSDPPFTDYTIRFSPCQQFEAYFMHVSSIHSELLDRIGPPQEANCRQYSTGGSMYNYCEHRGLRIEIREGEVLGTAGGRAWPNSLDMGAIDARLPPLAYANPQRLDSNPSGLDFYHVVCPVDYFAADVRSQLMALFGDWDGDVRRTVEPVCGEVMQDIPGTAQGKWYLRGTIESFPEDPHLALVRDNKVPTRAVFSIGTSVPGLDSSTYRFNPHFEGSINLDFSEVTPGEMIYCYSEFITRSGFPDARVDLRLLLQLTPESVLRIEAQPGIDCRDAPYTFGENVTEFER
jgi:hypothetical protein